MSFNFSSQQFAFMQSITNEMFQTDMLRTGPMGGKVQSVRAKFLTQGPVTLTDAERRFLLTVLQDVNITSRSPIVQSQFGITMKFQSPLPLDDPNQSQTQLRSTISTIGTLTQGDVFTNSSLQGSYLSMWQVMQQCMTVLGQAAPPPPLPQPVSGPTGDPGGIDQTIYAAENPDDRIMQQSETQLSGG